MKHIIIAPHADDELIGCWSLIRNPDVDTEVLYINPPTQAEQEAFKKRFPWSTIITLADTKPASIREWVEETAKDYFFRFYFPDARYEHHPLHKFWGSVGEGIITQRIAKQVAFYTTNMRAPYLREADFPQEKLEALDAIYPLKSTLWRYDHRYWLFQGICLWI